MIPVLIATYNRPGMLNKLIEDIKQEEIDTKIIIADDGSSKDYKRVKAQLRNHDKFIHFGKNHGKQEYYKVVNRLFSEVQPLNFDYVITLDDDVRLKPKALERAIDTLESIPFRSAEVLNLMRDERTEKASWNGVEAEKFGYVWKSGWVDMIWIAKYNFVRSFNFRLPPSHFMNKKQKGFWEHNPQRSSQVGKWLTLNLWRDGRFWSVENTLVEHGNHESKMNPNERIENPITSK